jgi:rubredoxin---NAD+ reductase
MTAPIVIIGSGLAAWSTVRELRKLEASSIEDASGNRQQPITMICADSGDFYAKPTLSNALAQKRTPAQLVTTPAAKMAEMQNVTLMANTSVHKIDTAARMVQTSQGDVGYDRLVLALGASPIRVPTLGDAAHEILSVNSIADFAVFHAKLEGAPKHVAIMGAGLIGCEFANDLVLGGHTVSVVDPAPRALAALIDESTSLALQSKLAPLGVTWHFGTTVTAVSQAQQGLQVYSVQLENSKTFEVDLVLSAIGLRPHTQLAKDAGLATDRGIVVNELLETSDPAIFALGDCAQYGFVSGNIQVLPYVMPVMHASRALASTLAGKPQPVRFPAMPVRVKTPAHPITVASPV